ncbi:MAG: protein-tyrosine-phosphatase [Alphaproteobacteria bacterium]|nr:protein-tyrosine-phosphatase [Alphaproteobacteria bacterium]
MHRSIATLTICGIAELDGFRAGGVTHVMSILDPGWPTPEPVHDFTARLHASFRYHDAIAPGEGVQMPAQKDVEDVLAFGDAISQDMGQRGNGHLLIHCHMGVSRSSAAMTALLTKFNPGEDEDALLARLLRIRPKAWPNSRMIGFADLLLGRGGRLTSALGRLYRRQLADYPDFEIQMRRLARDREIEMGRAAGRIEDRMR